MRRPQPSPMLWRFAAFEFRYQLLSPLFFISTAIFFALTYAFVTVPEMSRPIAGVSHVNSPHAITALIASMASFAIFIPVAFLSNVVLRDRHFETEGLFYSRPVTEFDYLAGRFLGAFAVCCVVLLAAPIAILAGAATPGLDPETVGPLRPFDYIFNYLVFGVANLLIPGALMFTVANVTRSTLAAYTATVIFLVLYFASAPLYEQTQYRTALALLDPYGYYAYAEAVRYWSPHELNTQLAPMQGLLLWNRLIWLALAVGLLIYNVMAFSFRAGVERRIKRRTLQTAESAKEDSAPVAVALTFGAGTVARQFWLRLRYEITGMLRSYSIWVLVLVGVGLVLISPLALQQANGMPPVYPVTSAMIEAANAFAIVPMIVLIYFASELVWRDRRYRMHEILDTTPTPSWVFIVSKLAAMWLLILILFAVATATAIAMQVALGHAADVDVWLYVRRMLFMNAFSFYLLAVLSVFLQVLTNNRFAGMGAFILLAFVLNIVLDNLGFTHNLYQYAQSSGAPYSDMNGDGHFLVGRFWFLFYWTLVAALLVLLTVALWNRGVLTPIWRRLRAAPARLGRVGAAAVALLLVAITATGGYIFYNTNILNIYRTSADLQQLAVDYERAYRQYEDLPQPRITDIRVNLDIFPRERRYEARGDYVIENKTGAPVPSVHLDYGLDTIIRDQQLEGARLVASDQRFNHFIWQFDAPLQPGERRTLNFAVALENVGFRNANNGSSVIWNGAFINNFETFPVLGFNPRAMLQDRQTRRRHGLEPLDRMPPLENAAAAQRNYIGADADWATFEATVSTSPDQIAIAPGYLQREWVENGRRYFHYKMDAPILNFFAFLSARYEVAEEMAGEVRLQVFYHPAHRYNVQRMIEGMRDAVVYNTAAFSPFQHRQMRIFEFPRLHGTFAQSFPNSVPYSEAAGFITDNTDPNGIDFVYYITAHEVAHQWWAHQVIGGNVQGATMLSETFAQYSALMLMKREYGEHHVRRFLRYELDQYLNARSGETVAELPLYRVENQMHIHYNKGSLVMYALQDYIGEDVVNRALSRFLREYGYASSPYPRTTDFLRILRAEAGPQYDSLITDLFERIVMFDLKATKLSVEPRVDGRFDVRLAIEAQKFEVDGQGVETEAPLDYQIDIGLFSRNPDDVNEGDDHVLLLERRPVRAGVNEFTFVLDKAPSFGGVDPHNKLIDRVSGDNLRPVDTAGANSAS